MSSSKMRPKQYDKTWLDRMSENFQSLKFVEKNITNVHVQILFDGVE